MPRYYIFYDSQRKAVRSCSKKPQHYPHLYVFQGGVTIFFSKNVKVTARDLSEAQYFLLAHELQAVDEQRREAFRSLRETLAYLEVKLRGQSA